MAHPYERLSEPDKYHLSLGQMVSAWSLFETQATFLALIIHKFGHGRTYEKEMPRALGRKLDMIRKAVAGDPEISDFASLTETLCQTAEMAALERNIIVHGSRLKLFADLPPIRVRLDQLAKTMNLAPEARAISHAQIIDMIRLACDLALTTSDLVAAFAEIFGLDQINQAAGERER